MNSLTPKASPLSLTKGSLSKGEARRLTVGL